MGSENEKIQQYEKLILSNECEITKLDRQLSNYRLQDAQKLDIKEAKDKADIFLFDNPDEADAMILNLLNACKKDHINIDLSAFRHDYTIGSRAQVDKDDLEKQRNEDFSTWKNKPKFSILTPVYNVRLCYMAELLCSVLDQTYPYFELCLADGSDDEHSNLSKLIRAVAASDSRIKYKKIKNHGISENTNTAFNYSKNEWIALLDHDDLLHPSALYFIAKKIASSDPDVVFTDEFVFQEIPQNVLYAYYKPDYQPDDLVAINYVNHLTAFKSSLVEQPKKFSFLKKERMVWDSSLDGSQDHDLVLRLTEKTDNIVHLPYVLYYWRKLSSSISFEADQESSIYRAGLRAVQEHLDRVSPGATASSTRFPGYYRIQYPIHTDPLVSIIILNKDNVDILKQCINSIISKTTWRNYEIIICENGSESEDTFEYYKELEANNIAHILYWPREKEFNFAAINNWGVKQSKGDYVLLLNSDIKVITCQWIEEMLMLAQRDNTGIVGCMLLYPNGMIQHAGCVVMQDGANVHVDRFGDPKESGYIGRNVRISDMPAVTGACMMLRRNVWDELDGMDENFAVAYNDIDLCLRARKSGKLVVYTPYAKMVHYEGFTRGFMRVAQKEIQREENEQKLFIKKHSSFLANDGGYYNIHLSMDGSFQECLIGERERSIALFLKPYRMFPIVLGDYDIESYEKLLISRMFEKIYASEEGVKEPYLLATPLMKKNKSTLSDEEIIDWDENCEQEKANDFKAEIESQLVEAWRQNHLYHLGSEYKLLLNFGNTIIWGKGIQNNGSADSANNTILEETVCDISNGLFLSEAERRVEYSGNRGWLWLFGDPVQILINIKQKKNIRLTLIQGAAIPFDKISCESVKTTVCLNEQYVGKVEINSSNNGGKVSIDVDSSYLMEGFNLLTLQCLNTWSPSEYGSLDDRKLGFALDKIVVEYLS